MVAFVLFCRLYYNLFVLISFYRCWAPSPLLFSWFPCDVVIGSLFDFLGTGVNCDKLYLAAAFAASHRSRYVRILIELAQANRFSFLISSLIQGYLRVSCIIALFDFFFSDFWFISLWFLKKYLVQFWVFRIHWDLFLWSIHNVWWRVFQGLTRRMCIL